MMKMQAPTMMETQAPAMMEIQAPTMMEIQAPTMIETQRGPAVQAGPERQMPLEAPVINEREFDKLSAPCGPIAHPPTLSC
jgi:hypothetical protein